MHTAVWTRELKHWLERRAHDLGFDLVGIAPVEGCEDPLEALDAARFEGWIEAGRAGEMDYLKRRNQAGLLLRSSPKVPQPSANSVIVCAMNYNAAEPLSTAPAAPTAGWIARYAWSGQPARRESLQAPTPPTSPAPLTSPSPSNSSPSRQSSAPDASLDPADYHQILLLRLQQLARELGHQTGAESTCFVDTGPLVERSLAARAGIGWIGKNTCVLNQSQGSWLLLGTIVSSLHLPPDAAALPAADLCGSCTRCLDACPTGALTAPREMDASLCIAYLTIEKKGSIPVDLRPLMGRQVFGCDICQDVCPWNRRAPVSVPQQMPARRELINPDLDWLAAMDAATFKRWFAGSPLERTRRHRLLRNVAIAMGNSADPRYLPRLQAWSATPDAPDTALSGASPSPPKSVVPPISVATSTTSSPPDPVLAETALWAIARIHAALSRTEPPNGSPCSPFSPADATGQTEAPQTSPAIAEPAIPSPVRRLLADPTP